MENGSCSFFRLRNVVDVCSYFRVALKEVFTMEEHISLDVLTCKASN